MMTHATSEYLNRPTPAGQEIDRLRLENARVKFENEQLRQALKLILSASKDVPPVSTGRPEDAVSCMALIAEIALEEKTND